MHQPVMVAEVIEGLSVRADGVYVDGTVNGGGHAEAIARKLGAGGMLLGVDRDASALSRARERLAGFETRVRLVHGNFKELKALAGSVGITEAHGILLDLGLSSNQLDEAERGFGFMRDGPLDMRMDKTERRTAAELVNTLAEEELSDLLFRYGEEPDARRIARRIALERKGRPIETTGRLAQLVEAAKGGRRGRIHPATLTFQALRVAVNGELEALEAGLRSALDLLALGGRLVVLSYHSLEDRAVKQFFKRHAGRWVARQAGGRTWEGERPVVERVNKKPLTASAEELNDNARARSAKCRIAEKKACPGGNDGEQK